MRKYRFTLPALLGLCLLAPTGYAPPAHAAAETTQVSALAPGMARVWFLRSSSPASPIDGADPIVYANGTPIGAIPANTDFYRDFPAGTYRFTAQPYGVPTGEADTVNLAAGTQTYLEVQWAPSWELGYTSAGPGYEGHAFAVLTMSPQVAQDYLPTLTYRGATAPSYGITQRGQGE